MLPATSYLEPSGHGGPLVDPVLTWVQPTWAYTRPPCQGFPLSCSAHVTVARKSNIPANHLATTSTRRISDPLLQNPPATIYHAYTLQNLITSRAVNLAAVLITLGTNPPWNVSCSQTLCSILEASGYFTTQLLLTLSRHSLRWPLLPALMHQTAEMPHGTDSH